VTDGGDDSSERAESDISIILYIAVATVAVGAIGASAMANSSSPLQTAAQTFRLPLVFWVVGIAATTAMLGVLLSQIVGISRMMFAMARRGDLPRTLEHVSSGYSVPDYGILLSGFAALGLTSCLLLAVSLPLVTIITGLGLLMIGFAFTPTLSETQQIMSHLRHTGTWQTGIR